MIVGPNACGKSTLLRALARLLRPTTGHVILDGEQIHRLPTKEVARRLGLLPADTDRSGGHPRGRPRGPRPHPASEAVPAVVGIRRTSASTPHSTATSSMDLADRPVDELSGGQRQRVWIAMTLAQETDLLLLDEPTTFLDIAHQIDVLDLCEQLNHEQQRTVVLVLHDLNLACRYADHIVAMRDGVIVAAGPPAEVITADNVRDVFGLDCVVIDDPVSHTPLVVPIGSRHATRHLARRRVVAADSDGRR